MMVSVVIENECASGCADEELIRRIAGICLEIEGISSPCQVSVLLTDDVHIREINREWRSTDRETDVLSFPALPFSPGFLGRDHQDLLKESFDVDTGCCFLGDIVISLERAKEQAEEYGHSIFREVAFLTAHSMLHLFGYDHMEEADRIIMEQKQEEILSRKGYTRDYE